MTRRVASLSTFCTVWWACNAWAADMSSQRALEEGMKRYRESAYEQAAEKFAAAAEQAAETGLDPAVPRYNRANALFKGGRIEDAAQAYLKASKTTDLELQSKVHFNQGNVFMALTERAARQGNLQDALQNVEQALDMYENSITLDPADEDAKVNYELALRRKEELQQQLQPQQQQQQKQREPQGQEEQEDAERKPSQRDRPEDSQPPQPPERQAEDRAPQDGAQQQRAQGNREQQLSAASEEMTPEEAEMLLEALRQEEMETRSRMRLRLGQRVPVEKDW